jgi:hypothetical protein
MTVLRDAKQAELGAGIGGAKIAVHCKEELVSFLGLCPCGVLLELFTDSRRRVFSREHLKGTEQETAGTSEQKGVVGYELLK